MNIVFFSNPDFFGSQKVPGFLSMPRFTNMLADGMAKRGHQVSIWSPRSKFFNLPLHGFLKKWMGYVDQYVVFPKEVKRYLKVRKADTLYVFTDQAQGPWIPLVSNKKHVMHCHDFIAQLSALDKIEAYKTGWTGKRYQRFIRNGCTKGKHFISISYKTRDDLLDLLPEEPLTAAVVYNGLDELFKPIPSEEARDLLKDKVTADLSAGYLLHVGGNQWYKNRMGVIDIYNAWRSLGQVALPLLLIGLPPSADLAAHIEQSPYKQDIHVISGLPDEFVRYAYAGASVLLFPSFTEGFGWPIAEAMASGGLVLTTNEAPMTEVAGKAGFLIPRCTPENEKTWADDAAQVVQRIVGLSAEAREKAVAASIENAKRFDLKIAMDQIEHIYKNIANQQIG